MRGKQAATVWMCIFRPKNTEHVFVCQVWRFKGCLSFALMPLRESKLHLSPLFSDRFFFLTILRCLFFTTKYKIICSSFHNWLRLLDRILTDLGNTALRYFSAFISNSLLSKLKLDTWISIKWLKSFGQVTSTWVIFSFLICHISFIINKVLHNFYIYFTGTF